MERRKKIAIAGVSVLAAGAGAVGIAAAGGGDSEAPIPEAQLDRASKAALEETGGGTVTDTEAGDEESYYEVEVTLEDGSQTDVQLNRNFEAVASETDAAGEDEGTDD